MGLFLQFIPLNIKSWNCMLIAIPPLPSIKSDRDETHVGKVCINNVCVLLQFVHISVKVKWMSVIVSGFMFLEVCMFLFLFLGRPFSLFCCSFSFFSSLVCEEDGEENAIQCLGGTTIIYIVWLSDASKVIFVFIYYILPGWSTRLGGEWKGFVGVCSFIVSFVCLPLVFYSLIILLQIKIMQSSWYQISRTKLQSTQIGFICTRVGPPVTTLTVGKWMHGCIQCNIKVEAPL